MRLVSLPLAHGALALALLSRTLAGAGREDAPHAKMPHAGMFGLNRKFGGGHAFHFECAEDGSAALLHNMKYRSFIDAPLACRHTCH